jgi:hypothetical protein
MIGAGRASFTSGRPPIQIVEVEGTAELYILCRSWRRFHSSAAVAGGGYDAGVRHLRSKRH